jgi:hypothetical protein
VGATAPLAAAEPLAATAPPPGEPAPLEAAGAVGGEAAEELEELEALED